MKRLLYIFVGGFFGALLRHLFFEIPFLSHSQLMPLNTIVVNLIGCFLLSVVVHLAEKSVALNDDMHAAIITGLLGAFTTFATFSKNVGDMIHSSNFAGAGIYLTVSLLGGFICVYLGYIFSNKVYKNLKLKS